MTLHFLLTFKGVLRVYFSERQGTAVETVDQNHEKKLGDSRQKDWGPGEGVLGFVTADSVVHPVLSTR